MSRDDLTYHWMINEKGTKSADFKNVTYDPNKFKVSLQFEKMKVTYQAIDQHDYQSMEILIDRLNKEHPGLVLLPLCSQITQK